MAFGVVLVLGGLPLTINWRGHGDRAFRTLLPVLPRWYHRRGLIAFRIWIGGGMIVFGFAVLTVASVGLTR